VHDGEGSSGQGLVGNSSTALRATAGGPVASANAVAARFLVRAATAAILAGAVRLGLGASDKAQEDDEEANLSAAGKTFVELIETFAPPTRERSQSNTRPIHAGTQCDHCNQTPIVGTRYYCMDCEERDEQGCYTGGYDLCEACFKKAKESQKKGEHIHPADHEFIEITQPDEPVADVAHSDDCKLM